MKPKQSSSSLSDRDAFVTTVTGYSNLPTQWELSHLAAMVGSNVPEDHSFLSAEAAEARVSLAMHIWEKAAGRLNLEKIYREKIGRSFDERYTLRTCTYPQAVDGYLLKR